MGKEEFVVVIHYNLLYLHFKQLINFLTILTNLRWA